MFDNNNNNNKKKNKQKQTNKKTKKTKTADQPVLHFRILGLDSVSKSF